MVTKVQL